VFFDTVNILIDPLKMTHGLSDTTIEAAVDMAVSDVRAVIYYNDSTKYGMPSTGAEVSLGETVITSSFDNEPSGVRYEGYKQVKTAKIKLNYRTSNSVKIRIFVKNTKGSSEVFDMFRAFSISYLTSGRIIDNVEE